MLLPEANSSVFVGVKSSEDVLRKIFCISTGGGRRGEGYSLNILQWRSIKLLLWDKREMQVLYPDKVITLETSLSTLQQTSPCLVHRWGNPSGNPRTIPVMPTMLKMDAVSTEIYKTCF